ncbi:hypothetical protein D5Q25_21830 [Salmonella enterica subsp. enterica serovar Chester]|nr:hypothetical protein [Salmonella enterica subsp. enterica serovar Chester]
MVTQALRVSIPWFTFVNISFALIILFRHILISDFDKSISAQTGILPLIDDIMGSIIIFSFLILLFIYRLPARFTPLCLVMLLILSLMWSYCSYCFIVWWQLPFAWPLSVILMLTALAALYYHLPALLLFIVPLWLTALLASVQLNQYVNIRFLLVWLTGLKPGTITRARKESWMLGREYLHISPDGNPKPSSECIYNREAVDQWIEAQKKNQPGAKTT